MEQDIQFISGANVIKTLTARINAMEKVVNEINARLKNEPEILTEARVAKILNYSKRQMLNLRDKGKISYYKDEDSRRVFYKTKDIEEYLNKHYKKAFK